MQTGSRATANLADTPSDTDATPASNSDTPQPPAGFSLDHMESFRNKVNMMQTDMPYAVVSTSADPPLSRPDVVVMVPTASGNLPPRRDLLNTVRGVVQGGKLGKHSGYRMEAFSHPTSADVTAQAVYFYQMEDGSSFPGQVVCCQVLLVRCIAYARKATCIHSYSG